MPPCSERAAAPAQGTPRDLINSSYLGAQDMKDSRQEDRALRERSANDLAAAEGRPLPFPNIWDTLDPSKVAPGATPSEVHASYLRFTALCRPRQRKVHRL